jgi:hypothetical protein
MLRNWKQVDFGLKLDTDGLVMCVRSIGFKIVERKAKSLLLVTFPDTMDRPHYRVDTFAMGLALGNAIMKDGDTRKITEMRNEEDRALTWKLEHINDYISLEMLAVYVHVGETVDLGRVVVSNINSLRGDRNCVVCTQVEMFEKNKASNVPYRTVMFGDELLYLFRHHKDPERYVAWSSEHLEFSRENVIVLGKKVASVLGMSYHVRYHLSSIINHAHVHLVPRNRDIETINQVSLFKQVTVVDDVMRCKGLIDYLWPLKLDECSRIQKTAVWLLGSILKGENIPHEGSLMTVYLEAMYSHDDDGHSKPTAKDIAIFESSISPMRFMQFFIPPELYDSSVTISDGFIN